MEPWEPREILERRVDPFCPRGLWINMNNHRFTIEFYKSPEVPSRKRLDEFSGQLFQPRMVPLKVNIDKS